MNKSEIFNFLNANQVFHLATIEGNKPHVRGLLLYKADEKRRGHNLVTGDQFCTKRVYRVITI